MFSLQTNIDMATCKNWTAMHYMGIAWLWNWYTKRAKDVLVMPCVGITPWYWSQWLHLLSSLNFVHQWTLFFIWTERVKGYRCCNWFQIKWLFKKLTINPNLNCNTHGGLGFQPVTLVLPKREKKHIFVWQFELFPQIYLISLSLSLSLSLSRYY